MAKICIHVMVSGKVQGVFYRAESQSTALALGITGWVRNRENGCVEVMACGETKAIESFQQWLAIGPARAKVADLAVKEVPYQRFEQFEILSD